jgi:hypothetical protein
MDDVIYSSEDLFNTIVKYVSSDDFKRTHKSDFEKDFQTHLENIRADWAVKFLFSKNGSGSIYDKTIDTVLKILENLELVDILLGITIMPKIRDIGGMLDDDNVTWDYIISALGRNGKIDNNTKHEIFNTGKGLFFRSLDYLTTDTECSHYLIWKSCKEYQIIQKNETFEIEFPNDDWGTVYESLEWLLEPHRNTDNNEDDFSLLYQAHQEFLTPESLLYFWQIMSELGYIPKTSIGEDISFSPGTGLTTGIEYILSPRGQLFDGTCLAASFELVCDHLTNQLPALRNDSKQHHSIALNHDIGNIDPPPNTRDLDGTIINWNQGMIHSAILGQTPRMWLLAESFGFSVALHSPDEDKLRHMPMTLPWYKRTDYKDFSDRHAPLIQSFEAWKQRMLEVLLRGNLPIVCIESADYDRKLQDGKYVWCDGNMSQEREERARNSEIQNPGSYSGQDFEGPRIGHALTISGVHLRKPKTGEPVLLWKVLDSNPGHNFVVKTSDKTGVKFDSSYSTAQKSGGGDTLWMTSSEIFSMLDKGDVWIHEIGWVRTDGNHDSINTAKYRPLTNFEFHRD